MAAAQTGAARRTVFRARLVAALAVVAASIACASALAPAGASGTDSGTLNLTPGKSASADSGVTFTDGIAAVDYRVAAPPTGGSVYLALQVRDGGHSAYRAKVRLLPSGTLRLGASRVERNAESSLGSVPVSAAVVTGPTTIHLQAAISGSGPVRLTARVWLAGQPAPASWQFSASDDDPVVDAGGRVQAWSYLSASADPFSVDYSGLAALSGPEAAPTQVPVTTTPASQSPTPSATSTTRKPTSTTSPSTTTSEPKTPPSASGGVPSASNTGVPAGTSLKQHDGDLTITKDGATYSNLDIHGFVTVKAADVTIKNSIVRGGTATGNRGLVTVSDSSASNFLIEDSTLVPEHPSVWLDDLKGNNFTARRIDASGGVDAVKVHGDNVRVEDSWLHGLRSYSSDPNQGGGPTHNDGVQVLGGRNIDIVGNKIEGGGNAGVQVTQDYSAVVGLVFDDNRVAGGDCNVKINNKGLPSMSTVKVRNNSFSGGSTHGCAILRTPQVSLVASGNVMAGNNLTAQVEVD